MLVLRTPWIAQRKAIPAARMRLVCFPHGGSGASLFRGWQTSLAPAVEVCPVQLAGRETRCAEPPSVSLAAVIPPLAAALEPLFGLPFAFFGHSLGALIAFEVARRLRDSGRPTPCRLFVSAYPSPDLPRRQEKICNLPDPEFLAAVSRLGGLGDDLLATPEALQQILPAIRADYALVETYQYRASPPLPCPIHAFGGTEDGDVSSDELAGWKGQTAASFDLRYFSGNHFFLKRSFGPLLESISQLMTLPGKEH